MDSMKKKRFIILILPIVLFVPLLIVITAGFVFRATVHWDGRFPSNQFRIKVTDNKGEPITTSYLSVFNEYERTAYEHPIDEFTKEEKPQADESGIIVVHHTGEGLEFGGSYTELFGIIRWPPGSVNAPEYYIDIEADGYTKERLRYSDLVKGDYEEEPSEKVIIQRQNQQGETEEHTYTVSEKTVVLKQK
ncbi:MAG: hypothetical protein ACYSSP_08280 [Planctomycetota bacterium]|jgi:hypothetical protein